MTKNAVAFPNKQKLLMHNYNEMELREYYVRE